MLLIRILLFLGLQLTVAHARLGESFEESQKRYGPPISETDIQSDRLIHFEKNGILISAFFVKDKSVAIRYSKLGDRSAVHQLLKLELGSARLVHTLTQSDEYWAAKDGTVALFDRFSKGLFIGTPQSFDSVHSLTSKELGSASSLGRRYLAFAQALQQQKEIPGKELACISGL
jgi:hypothetical protein